MNMQHVAGQNQPGAVYFPSLNGLRLIAALFVVVDHIESMKLCFLLPNRTQLPFFQALGKLGVVLFFVLSGFLITYLLLVEEKNTGRIQVKKFYLRRVLRIWPLYFLVIGFSLWLAPRMALFSIPSFESCLGVGNDGVVTLLLFLLCSNGVVAWFGSVPYAVQTWSIGTEEQFYLIWPWIIKKMKNRMWAFTTVVVLYTVVKILLQWLQHHSTTAKLLLDFWYYFNIDCMAIGAVGAYWVFYRRNKVLRWIFNRSVQVVVYAALLLLIGFGIKFRYFHFEIFAVLFCVVILNLAANPRSIFNLEYRWLHYLGSISYGIYMYHFIAITLVLRAVIALDMPYDILIYPGSILCTILISAVSYRFFEGFFLRLKKRV